LQLITSLSGLIKKALFISSSEPGPILALFPGKFSQKYGFHVSHQSIKERQVGNCLLVNNWLLLLIPNVVSYALPYDEPGDSSGPLLR
jgi:hypothetical protein